jgi:hypothetical protein
LIVEYDYIAIRKASDFEFSDALRCNRNLRLVLTVFERDINAPKCKSLVSRNPDLPALSLKFDDSSSS